MLFDLFLEFPVVLVLGLCVVVVYLLARRERDGNYPLPPGPKGFPIIGNLLDMPTSDEWVTFQKWSKDFGLGPFYLASYTTTLIRYR